MQYQLFLIPVISAFIGYITNVFAIKLLFWPKQPINLGIFKLYGLLPKRQAEIAVKIGEVVENELLSLDDVFDQVNTPGVHNKLTILLTRVIKERLSNFLPGFIPAKVTQIIVDNIEKILQQELPALISQFINLERNYITKEIQIRKIVADRINDFDLDELEAMIKGVALTELRFIEMLGGVLGFIIGIIQVVILIIFPY